MNILLVEDNLSIIKGLTFAFNKSNYNLTIKTDVKSTKEYLEDAKSQNKMVDLIILDVMLPDGDGFVMFNDFIKLMNIPTIFLTARDDEDDIVASFVAGAEDYLTKPFSTKELMARVNKVLLRKENKNIVTVKDITFDLDKMILNINKVVRRYTLIDTIFDATGNYVDDHTITVYFKRIREKLGTDIIVTIKGVGYRIDDEKQN